MATTTINIKDDLYDYIKLKAEAHGRSVSSEITFRYRLAVKYEKELLEMREKELGLNDVAIT